VKIVVAIPTYDGKLQIEVVRCLLDERVLAGQTGDDLKVQFLPSCSHAAMGRNQLAQEFMDSDADRLIFLDADVSFEPGALLKLAHHKADFVGGAYRFKNDTEAYPVMWLHEKELWTNADGLMCVAALPGGFLSLSRKVFEDLQAAHPERKYSHQGKEFHCHFQMLFTEGTIYGEDTFFCKEWRDLGNKVFLDPEITLTHWHFNKPYVGHIGNWLKNRNAIA
jgi:hypothetical protein